jgi:hypothetical protein
VGHVKRVVAGSIAGILVGMVMVDNTTNHIILARIALLLSLVEKHLLMIVARNK